jgi:hypothetical protein
MSQNQHLSWAEHWQLISKGLKKEIHIQLYSVNLFLGLCPKEITYRQKIREKS